MEVLVKFIGYLVLGAVLVFFGACLFAFPVKWLWNWLMPMLFGLKAINAWQAWGLMTLCGILFKSSSSSKSSS